MPATASSKIDPHDIGKYPRSYDDIEISDDNDDDEDEKEASILAEVLKWTSEKTQGQFYGHDQKAFKDLLRMGVELERLDNLSAIRAIKASPFKDNLIDKTFDLLKDVYYALRDVFARKKVKTALTVLAGIGLGAAAGAALGTLVLPGIGSAGGAILGAASGIFATVGPIVGGTIGLSILGGVAGGWLGKFASKKIYRDEHRFGLSKRVTTKLKERSGVRSKTAELINGYLYNRQKTAKNPILKRVYKDLRKEGIHHAEPVMMEKIARFFCHELSLLQREIDPEHNDLALQQEIQAVVTILEDLSHSKKFSKGTQRRIKETLQTFKQVEGKVLGTQQFEVEPVLPSGSVKPTQKKAVQFSTKTPEALHGMRFVERHALDPQQLKNVNKKFQEAIKPYHLKHVEVKQKKHEGDRTIEFRCKLPGEERVKIIFQQAQVSDEAFTAGVYIEKKNLKKENQAIVLGMLVKGIEALQSVNSRITQQQILTIDAEGDDEVAIQFMAAALKAKIPVQLNDKEYPPALNARRVKIELEAHRLAKLTEEPQQIVAAKKKQVVKPSKSR